MLSYLRADFENNYKMDSNIFEKFQQLLCMGNTTESSFGSLDLSSQMKLRDEEKVPPCYKATNHDSHLTKLGFIHAFEQEGKENARMESLNKTLDRSKQKVPICRSTRPAIEHGVAPDFTKQLIRTTIQEVAQKVNHIHKNHVMFVKTIHAPLRLVGTVLLVEDEKRDCIMLSLYNYVAHDEDPKDVFPVGTHLALLDPYMKNSQDDRSKNLILRCDNPQCVIVYDENLKDEVTMWWKSIICTHDKGTYTKKSIDNPSVFRRRGNEEFAKSNFTSASAFYSKALATNCIDSEEKVACLSNRAEVRLRQQRWEDALEDAQNALIIQPDHIKAKFRLAKALVRLERLSEVQMYVDELEKKEAKNQRAIKSFISEYYRLKKEKNGIYDYQEMREKASTNNVSGLENFHADFTSPKVEIGVNIDCRSGTSYRGCRAMQDIDANELIVASKAFAFAEECETNCTPIVFDVYGRRNHSGSDVQLIEQIVKLLWIRPYLGKDFYSLSSGDENSSEKKNFRKIDLPTIRQIESCNSFAQTDETEKLLIEWNYHKKEQEGLVKSDLKEREDLFKVGRGAGLWLKESMFNHSCYPNCSWTQIGKHMFIRATREIKQGEELCVSYVPPNKSFEERKNIFCNWIKHNTGFSCACERCHLLRTHQNLRKLDAKVEDAYKKIEMVLQATTNTVPMNIAIESIIPSHQRKLIKESFRHLPLHLQNNTIYKLCIFEGEILNSLGDSDGALEQYEKAAEIGYATRGNAFFDYFEDLWRITGASLSYGKRDVAYESYIKFGKVVNIKLYQKLMQKSFF